jgi:hypothetical protein
LSNHCQGLRCTFYDIFTKFDAHLLSDPLWNRIRPNTGCGKLTPFFVRIVPYEKGG